MPSLGFKVHAAALATGLALAGATAMIIGDDAEKNMACDTASMAAQKTPVNSPEEKTACAVPALQPR